jgi:hypothetical protein
LNSSGKNKAILKNAFFREIETMHSEIRPYYWLLDSANERSVSIDEQILFHSVVQFTDLLFTNANELTRSVYTTNSEKGKPCMYSSFGYANLNFPKEKIREYFSVCAFSKELDSFASELDTKHEVISIKEEVSSFFRVNEFDKLNEKLSRNVSGEFIFNPFRYNITKFTEEERINTIDKPLSVIENAENIAGTTTSHFFHDVEEEEKKYANDISSDYSQQLDSSKKRVIENVFNLITERQNVLLDSEGKGINYSLLFAAILANNKALVESMLEGRFTNDIPTFNKLQENFRSLFIGEEVGIAQKVVDESSDKVLNNSNLIERYDAELTTAMDSVEKLKASPDAANPKISELNSKIENYESQISKLTAENEELNKLVSERTLFVESKKNEFDQDPTKESFKTARKEKIMASLSNLKDEKIPSLDKQLTESYSQKNLLVDKRKRFIFYKLQVIPGLLALLMVLSCVFAYLKVHEDLNMLWKSLIFSGATLLIYFLFYLAKFSRLKKEFEDLLSLTVQQQALKTNQMTEYVAQLNALHCIDFEFERDLITLSMIAPFSDFSSKIQNTIGNFKQKILDLRSDSKQKIESFTFESDPFDFCIVSKGELEKIYDSSVQGRLFGALNKDSVKISELCSDFEVSQSLNKLTEPIQKISDEIFNSKINSENLRDVLINNSSIFETKNLIGNFQKLIQSSRPLLRTEKLSPEMPLTQEITVGLYDSAYQQYLSEVKINNSIKLQESNADRFGLISIKSNFPSFLIYDVPDNENIVSEIVNRENKETYFLNEEAYLYSLNPDLENKGALNPTNSCELLFIAIGRAVIKYDEAKACFMNEEIGELGSKWDELIKMWNSKICSGIVEESKQKYDLMLSEFEENDFVEFAGRLKSALLSIKMVIPKEIEEEVSVLFFSVFRGSEVDWIEVSDHFKTLRKKSI